MLWQQKFRSGVVVSQSPIVSGDQIYVVAAGGTGCKAVRLTTADTAEVVYANKVMKNLPGGVVLFDGHIYGYSDSIGWVCQDWLTGDEVWSSKAFEKFRAAYDWKVLATGPNHSIQLRTGRLIVPVWLLMGTGGGAHRPYVTSTIYSDDRGPVLGDPQNCGGGLERLQRFGGHKVRRHPVIFRPQ